MKKFLSVGVFTVMLSILFAEGTAVSGENNAYLFAEQSFAPIAESVLFAE